MDDLEQLIHHIGRNDFASASSMFQELMATKLNDALDAEQVKVASEVYGDTIDDDIVDEEDFEEDEDDESEEESEE